MAIGIIILNSRFKNAMAPSLTADEIFIILSVPLFCFPTHTARAAAAAIDTKDEPIGSTPSNTIKTLCYDEPIKTNKIAIRDTFISTILDKLQSILAVGM